MKWIIVGIVSIAVILISVGICVIILLYCLCVLCAITDYVELRDYDETEVSSSNSFIWYK